MRSLAPLLNSKQTSVGGSFSTLFIIADQPNTIDNFLCMASQDTPSLGFRMFKPPPVDIHSYVSRYDADMYRKTRVHVPRASPKIVRHSIPMPLALNSYIPLQSLRRSNAQTLHSGSNTTHTLHRKACTTQHNKGWSTTYHRTMLASD